MTNQLQLINIIIIIINIILLSEEISYLNYSSSSKEQIATNFKYIQKVTTQVDMSLLCKFFCSGSADGTSEKASKKNHETEVANIGLVDTN